MAIFKEVSKMIDYDPEGREKLSDQISRTASIEDLEASKKLSNEVGCTLAECIHSHGWMAKAARTARVTDPWYVGRTISPWIAVVALGAMVFTKTEWYMVAGVLAITVGLFLLCNPHDIISRWMAIQTRIITFMDITLLTCGILSKNPYLILAFLIWAASTGWICWHANSKWLFAQNMLRSETVRTALVQCDDIEGMKRWNDCGMREVRTFAAEAGLPFDSQVLETAYLGVWLCGWYSDHIEMQEKSKLKEQIERLKEEAGKDAETIQMLEDHIDDLNEEIRKRETDPVIARLKNANDGLKHLNDTLQKRIKELEEQMAEQKELSPEEQLRQQIYQLRDTMVDGHPMSIAKITAELKARGIKVSNGKVGDICKEYKEMKEAS